MSTPIWGGGGGSNTSTGPNFRFGSAGELQQHEGTGGNFPIYRPSRPAPPGYQDAPRVGQQLPQPATPPQPMPTRNPLIVPQGYRGRGPVIDTFTGPPQQPNQGSEPLFWEPEFENTRRSRRIRSDRGSSGGGAPRLMLPNNTPSTHDQVWAGTSQSMGGGWWHNPLYSTQNAGGWWNDNSGAGQNMNRAPMGVSQGDQGFLGGFRGAAQSGGGSGGGGGGYSGVMGQYQSLLDAANAANEKRYNQILEGQTAGRRRSSQLLDQLGGQQRRDTNRIFDRNHGKLLQDAISRGMTNSTVTSNMERGNERVRSERLSDVEEGLARQRLDTEYKQLQDTLGIMERREDPAPDASLWAQMAQAAAAGGNGSPMPGSPMVVGGDDISFQFPDFGWGGGGFGGYQGRGSQLQRGTGMRGRGYGGGFGGLMGSNGEIIPGFPGTYPGMGTRGTGGTPGATDPDLILNGNDYDYNALFGNGPGYSDYEWGSYPF